MQKKTREDFLVMNDIGSKHSPIFRKWNSLSLKIPLEILQPKRGRIIRLSIQRIVIVKNFKQKLGNWNLDWNLPPIYPSWCKRPTFQIGSTRSSKEKLQILDKAFGT